jgi:CHAD domain-containing protein
LHRVRIASRKLRELVPLLGASAVTQAKLGRRLGRVTRALGGVRELDVLSRLIADLEEQRRYSSAALQRVAATVGSAQASARQQLNQTLPPEKLERLAVKLKRLARSCKQDRANGKRRSQTVKWVLEARQIRRALQLRSAIEAAGTLYSSEPLHVVRVAIKKLRYSLEVAIEADARGMARAIADLTNAQEILGRLHDLEILLTWARQTHAEVPLPDLADVREHNVFVRAIEEDCRREHARYMRTRARLIAIADRIGRPQAMRPGATPAASARGAVA